MTLAPTFLIYRTGFAPTNGSSVQLERLFRDEGESLVHVMWDSREAGAKSVPYVVDTTQKIIRLQPPFAGLSRTGQRLLPFLVPTWWRWGKFNTARLVKELASFPIRPRQAYITFFNDDEAGRAKLLWNAVGRPPFVLQLWDAFESEISEEKAPSYVRMIRAASHVFCLNKLIQLVAERLGATATSLFPLCSDLVTSPRRAPPMPLKIVISGALYAGLQTRNHALKLLVEIWPALLATFPKAELHYSGAESRGLPADILPWIHDHGLLTNVEYQQLLASSHVAYVPVCHGRTSPLRYSLPSRIPDYLIQGLPVLACVEPETGPYEFFQSSPTECTRLIESGPDLLAAVQHFAGNAQRWEKASGIAIEFSRKTFGVNSARQLLFERLNSVGAMA